MTIVAFGSYRDPRPLALAERIQRAPQGATFVGDLGVLRSTLASRSHSCVVLESATSVREVARVIRQSEQAPKVALLVLVDRVSARLLSGLYADGADDVLTYSDLDGLSRRIASLAERPATGTRADFKGECVLAHADTGKLDDFARALELAGFEVLPASTASEVQSLVQRRSPVALVVSSSLPPEGGRRALRRLAETSDRDIPSVLLSAGNPGPFSPQGWNVVAEEAPPQNLLFVLNDLLRPVEQVDGRESRRLLYSTLCNFRMAGDLESAAGLTYNIGRGGLFVRTLAAPPRHTPLWLELAVPGGNQAVHLRAEVARTTAFGLGSAGPAGFGAQLVPQRSPSADFAQYVSQYSWLLELVTAAGA